VSSLVSLTRALICLNSGIAASPMTSNNYRQPVGSGTPSKNPVS
jgi:hypothetical protein